MPQNFVIVCSTNYKILTQRIIWRIQCIVANGVGWQDAGRKAAWCKTTGRMTTRLEWIVRRKLDEPRSQRWQRCRLQYCNSDGAEMLLLLQRCCSNGAGALRLNFLFFYFFYSIASGEKMRVRKKKRSEIRNLFPDSIGWHNTSSFL
jgi:hypothetical protein